MPSPKTPATLSRTRKRPGTQLGFESPGELDRPVVVSPHLDDAVLSCAHFLIAHPGTPVITIFAASPAEYSDPLNASDTACGFHPGDDTMAVRRAEDTASLRMLGAVPVWLEFCQHSHVPRPKRGFAIPDGSVDVLEHALRTHNPTAVLFPFGLWHPDHDVAHRIVLAVRDRISHTAWFCYQDKPYEHRPGVLSRRMVRLHGRGLIATPAALPVVADRHCKWRAISAYRSQLLGLEQEWRIEARIARAPEAYWRIEPDPTRVQERVRRLIRRVLDRRR
jgi:LmbE family N-acetylglucosaminyl deacetylase